LRPRLLFQTRLNRVGIAATPASANTSSRLLKKSVALASEA